MMAVTSVIHVLLQKTNVPETFSKRGGMFANGTVLVLFLQWSILEKEGKVQIFTRFEQFYRYTLRSKFSGGEKRRPEIGLRSQASCVTHIQVKKAFSLLSQILILYQLISSNADDKITLKWNTVGQINQALLTVSLH